MIEANSTAGMWIRMLGLEPMWQAANSPDFQQQIAQLVAAIIETRLRCERIEGKLDALLDAGEFAHVPRRRLTGVSAPAGHSDGPGGAVPPSVSTDRRGGDAAAADAGNGAGAGQSHGEDWRPY